MEVRPAGSEDGRARQVQEPEREYAWRFLLELARWLHAAYLPADEVERRVKEAARGLGLEPEIFSFQTVVLVGGSSGAMAGTRFLRVPFSPHWNLARLRALVALAEAVARGDLGLAAATGELDRIVAAKPLYPRWLLVVAYATYSAAVASRVGGGPREMASAALIGIGVGAILYGKLPHLHNELTKTLVAAFLGTVAALALERASPTFDAARAVFGAMTLLVPAMVITIGTHDVAAETTVESGVARLAYGFLRFVAIGGGIAAAGKLWSLFASIPKSSPASGLPIAALVAILAVGGVALMVCMHGRAADAGWIVVGVLLAWGSQEATRHWLGGAGSPFLAALVVGVVGQLQARRPGHFAATVILPGLLQLAPGFIGTQAVVALLRPGASGGETVFHLVLVSLEIVMGLVVSSVARAGGGTGRSTAEASVR